MARTKRGNGRLVRSYDAKSSQEDHFNPGTLFPRVRKHRLSRFPPPPGALQVSGGLRTFMGSQTARHRRKGEAYVRSRRGMSSKGWQGRANQHQGDERCAAYSASTTWLCRLFRSFRSEERRKTAVYQL